MGRPRARRSVPGRRERTEGREAERQADHDEDDEEDRLAAGETGEEQPVPAATSNASGETAPNAVAATASAAAASAGGPTRRTAG